MFAALIFGQPEWIGFLFLGSLAFLVFAVLVAAVVRSVTAHRKSMALLAELTVLQEETARLREEIDQLRGNRVADSTGIKEA